MTDKERSLYLFDKKFGSVWVCGCVDVYTCVPSSECNSCLHQSLWLFEETSGDCWLSFTGGGAASDPVEILVASPNLISLGHFYIILFWLHIALWSWKVLESIDCSGLHPSVQLWEIIFHSGVAFSGVGLLWASQVGFRWNGLLLEFPIEGWSLCTFP